MLEKLRKKHEAAVVKSRQVKIDNLCTTIDFDRTTALSRYRALLERRRTGRATKSELRELAAVTLALESEPAPPEFHETMISISKDRQSLRESMERIEQLLNRPA